MHIFNYNLDRTFEIQLHTDEATRIGEQLHFDLTIKNIANTVASAVFCLQSPLCAKPFGKKLFSISNLPGGESMTVRLSYTFTEGGCHQFYGWIEGRKMESLWKANFFMDGAGHYSGDTHSHSVNSDGTSTLEENRMSMRQKGHSFLYSTDHNYIGYADEIDTYMKSAEGFLHIAGWEFTSEYGHALAYGNKHPMDATCITGRDQVMQWQAAVDEMGAEGAKVFMAHPYEAPRFEFGDSVLPSLNNIVGLEVWNGLHHHALDYQNRRAFELWDQLNATGKQRYVGNAVSDYHSAEGQGSVFIKGYMDTLSEENVHTMLGSGSFFGSNGPEIRFRVNDVNMGGVVTGQVGDIANLRLLVFDPLGTIKEVVLYKIAKGESKCEKVFSYYPIGEEKTLWETDRYIPIEAGTFYRAEVIADVGAVTVSSGGYKSGFAFTNPVYIEF